MANVFSRRPYRAFLSHAHVDKKIVDQLYSWLTNTCGYQIWYDSVDFPSGFVAGQLGTAIENCQGAIIVLSAASIQSGWVEQEWNVCLEQQAARADFKILQLQIDDCAPPAMLRIRKWIDARSGFDVDAAIQLIEAFHSSETKPATLGRPQVYFSHGNRPDEEKSAAIAIDLLRQSGCRIVRDAPDQPSWSEKRISDIMSGCSGFVSVVPLRMVDGARTTSKYILDEVRLAGAAGVPALLVVDQGLSLDEATVAKDKIVCKFDPKSISDEAIGAAVSDFVERLREPPKPAYCFLGHAFRHDNIEYWPIAKRALQVVTGLPCLTGDGLHGEDIQSQIVERISRSVYSIFDITEDRLNSCVEAGVALGAGANFDLVCKAPRRRPPFMFRNRQVHFYETTTDLVGLVARLARAYRRVIL